MLSGRQSSICIEIFKFKFKINVEHNLLKDQFKSIEWWGSIRWVLKSVGGIEPASSTGAEF